MNPFYKHLLMFALLFMAGRFVSLAQPQAGTNAAGENFRLLLVDNVSQYSAVDQKNVYHNMLRLQNIDLTAADLNDGDNLFVFHREDNGGAVVVFATLNLHCSGYGPRTVTAELTYDNQLGGNDVLNFESRTYGMTDPLDVFDMINYVSDVFEVGTADNTHPTYYNYYVTYGAEVSGTGSGQN